MNRNKLYAALLIGIALGIAAYFLRPIDEKALIASQFKKLEQLASYPAEEHPLKKAHAIGQMKALMSPDLVLKVNLQGGRAHTLQGRKEFMERVQEVRLGLPKLTVQFELMSTELSSDGRSATVSMTLSAKIGREEQQEYQEMKAQMEKTADGWLIKQLETVKTYGR